MRAQLVSPVRDEQLGSLNRFLDVVFALMFFRILQFLPAFEDKHWTQLPHGLVSLLAGDPTNLMRIGFGVVMVVYYWTRKNALLSLLERSTGVLAVLSIASLCFVCLFMYALIADPMMVGGPPTFFLESASLAVAAFLGFVALRYAIGAELTRPELRPAVEQIARTDLSNPLTAVVAAGLSWSGPLIWTLSWCLIPVFAMFLAKGHKTKV